MSNIQINVTDTLVNQIVVSEEQQNIIRVLTSGGQGPAGTQIISGDNAPSNSIGRIGDYFLDKPHRNLYGPKTAGGWDLVNYIQLGQEVALEEVSDVNTSTKADQEVLMYDEDTGTWRNQRIRYRHEQGVPSDVWEVDHGLKVKPAAISVFDTSGSLVFGEIEHTNDNQLTLTFSAPFAGVAYLT